MHNLTRLLIVLALASFSLTPVHADGGSGGRSSPLAPFQKLIKNEKYQQAITGLDKALRDDPDNADMLNLLAYSHRQLEHYAIALDFYQQALRIEPRHRGANEYLGELYLQIGQLDKAEERLAVLDKACFFGCDEFDDLEAEIAEYRKQNSS
jgi:cytochrome c-type biogenesis protein CcmH/NrfG